MYMLVLDHRYSPQSPNMKAKIAKCASWPCSKIAKLASQVSHDAAHHCDGIGLFKAQNN